MKPNLNLNIGGKKAAPKAASGFLQLNLLPDVKKQLLKVRRERNMVISISIMAAIASAAVLVIISGILGSLKVYEAVARNSIKNSQKSIEESQKKDELDKYLTVQNQLVQIKGLKDKQQIYSRLLNYLVALNPARPNNVSLNTVTVGNTDDSGTAADASGGVTMTIEGRIADFSALDVYKTTLGSAKLKYTEVTDEDETASSSDDSNNSDSTSSDDESTSDKDDDNDKKDDNTKSVKLFSDVTVQEQALSSDSSGNGGGVSFTIQVTFDPLAFSSTIENPTVEVPNETTSDSSRNAPTAGSDSAAEMFNTIKNDNSTSATNGTRSGASNNSTSVNTSGDDNSDNSNGGSNE